MWGQVMALVGICLGASAVLAVPIGWLIRRTGKRYPSPDLPLPPRHTAARLRVGNSAPTHRT